MTAFLILLALLILYLLSLRGRRANPGLEALRGWHYAHRGLHNSSRPENSMSAFRAALDRGYGIELDIHLLKDGTLAVMHDSKLKRTTGQEGRIEDLTAGDLENYHLEGTGETIPTFRQVLDLFGGRAPMIIELKPEGGNHAALAEAACAMMEGYQGVWCMESFDPRCIQWLRKNRPDIIRGQLSDNYFSTKSPLPRVLQFLLTHNMANFLGRPDFIAYNFYQRRATPSNFLCQKLWGIQGVAWTIKTQADQDTAIREGWISIFEDFEP